MKRRGKDTLRNYFFLYVVEVEVEVRRMFLSIETKKHLHPALSVLSPFRISFGSRTKCPHHKADAGYLGVKHRRVRYWWHRAEDANRARVFLAEKEKRE